jgi:hypothetical protein
MFKGEFKVGHVLAVVVIVLVVMRARNSNWFGIQAITG